MGETHVELVARDGFLAAEVPDDDAEPSLTAEEVRDLLEQARACADRPLS